MPIAPITRLNIEKPKRACRHCMTEKDLGDFYTNTKWEEMNTKDVWCKDCVKTLKSKDEVRDYFWTNNRKWDEKIWTDSRNAAEKALLNNATYKSADSAQQIVILERMTCEQVPMLMNKPGYYNFEIHDGKTFEQAKSEGKIFDKIDEGRPHYDFTWAGDYTEHELEFLNNFYAKMVEGREDEIDYAQEIYIRNWAKANMNLNNANNALLRGEGSFEDVQKASAVCDMVGKTGQLAPKKKEDKIEEMSSVSEISLYLMQHGHPMTRKIEWEQDEVDAVLKDFMHLPVALGLQELN